MSILDEIAQQMDEPKPRRLSITTTGEFLEPRDLASPCIILPSALSTRHAKTGSIGESVFLGAGAKRKMDALAGDKENIDPQGKGKVRKSVVGRREVPTAMRPQSTGALRKQPQGRQYIVAPGMSELVSPMVPPTARPWSTIGARPSDMQWTTDTPMNHRQRVQQGEGIARPMSIDSAPARVGHGVFGNGMVSSMGMNPQFSQGMHHPSPLVSAGMEMYLTTDPHIAHPSSMPVHHTTRGSFTIPQDPHAPPTMQYIPYGVPSHGMRPFSNVPQQGTFMVYDGPHATPSAGPSGPRRYSQQHASVPRHGQAYVYPQYTPYQSLYVGEHDPTNTYPPGTGMHQDSQGPMLSYPTGMTLLAEEEPTHMGEEKADKRRRRTVGSAEVARGAGMVTAHLGMTISLPIPGMSTVDDRTGKHATEPIRTRHDMNPADQTTPPPVPAHEADGNPIDPMDPPPMTVNPTSVNPTPSEMDKVEREFVKFSDADGSDREGFWGNDSL